MIIEIGNKPLKEMIAEDLLQLVIIEGCSPVMEFNKEKIWSEPKMSDFDNKMFSDTHVIDYNSYRLIDNQKSSDFTLYFNFKDFTYHYTVDYENYKKNQKSKGNRLKLESIKFLIDKGYDVPLYNNA
jgi:hypothetical protein